MREDWVEYVDCVQRRLQKPSELLRRKEMKSVGSSLDWNYKGKNGEQI